VEKNLSKPLEINNKHLDEEKKSQFNFSSEIIARSLADAVEVV
jgi:hypothetical protein